MDKVRIKASTALADINSGMTDAQMMRKHGISVRGLYKLFKRLVEQGHLDPAKILGRGSFVKPIEIKTFKCSSCDKKVFDGFDACPLCGGPLERMDKEERIKDGSSDLDKRYVRRFLKDVKAGIGNEVLKNKYKLSGHAFLLRKAAAIDHLKGLETGAAQLDFDEDTADGVLIDIRAGMDDETVMLKYQITLRELQAILRRLISDGAATPLELSGRLRVTRSQVGEAFKETVAPDIDTE